MPTNDGPPKYTLCNVHAHKEADKPALVMLEIIEGYGGAGLSPARAQALAEELNKAAAEARALDTLGRIAP